MSTIVNTNIASLRGIANMSRTTFGLQESLEKLSSGYKINKAADDASGLAIATVMSAQIGGVRQAIANASDGINLIQTADGAYEETKVILLRMRDLAVKAGNDATLVASDYAKLQQEFSSLRSSLNAKLTRVTFNTKQVLNGAISNSPLQIGPDNGQTIKLTITKLDSTALKVNAAAVNTAAAASAAIKSVDQGISVLGTQRSALGTIQRRLNHVINDLTAQDINLSAARSRIMDTDFASEISNFTKLQILQQVGTSVLVQANTSPQSVIQLLG